MQILSFTSSDVTHVMQKVGVDHDQEQVLSITRDIVDPQGARIRAAGANSEGFRIARKAKDFTSSVRAAIHNEIAHVLFEADVIPEHPGFLHRAFDGGGDYRSWVLGQYTPAAA